MSAAGLKCLKAGKPAACCPSPFQTSSSGERSRGHTNTRGTRRGTRTLKPEGSAGNCDTGGGKFRPPKERWKN